MAPATSNHNFELLLKQNKRQLQPLDDKIKKTLKDNLLSKCPDQMNDSLPSGRNKTMIHHHTQIFKLNLINKMMYFITH